MDVKEAWRNRAMFQYYCLLSTEGLSLAPIIFFWTKCTYRRNPLGNHSFPLKSQPLNWVKITGGIIPTAVPHQVAQVSSSVKFRLDVLVLLAVRWNSDGIDLICLPAIKKLTRQNTSHPWAGREPRMFCWVPKESNLTFIPAKFTHISTQGGQEGTNFPSASLWLRNNTF